MFGFLKKNAKIPFIFRNFAAYSSDPISKFDFDIISLILFIDSRNALIKPYTIEQNSLVFSVYPLKVNFYFFMNNKFKKRQSFVKIRTISVFVRKER